MTAVHNGSKPASPKLEMIFDTAAIDFLPGLAARETAIRNRMFMAAPEGRRASERLAHQVQSSLLCAVSHCK